MQTHNRVPMEWVPDAPTRAGESGSVSATIPAEQITTRWDVMYHLEAVDVLGNAAFSPGQASENGVPYVVVSVAR